METKNAKVRRLVKNKEYKKALQICKDWDYEDPVDRSNLQRGYECMLYPEFYKQLGYDPDMAIDLAIANLELVYNSN